MSIIRPFSDVDLHSFVDDQISPERRSMIASYLKSAPAEAARVDSWRRQNDAIRSVFASAATEPVPLWLTIGHVASGRERQEIGGPGLFTRGGVQTAGAARGQFTVPLAAAVMVAAAFVAGMAAPTVVPQWASAIVRLLPGSPREDALRGFAERTLDAHRTYAIDPDRPAEMPNAGPGDLEAWLLRRVAFPVRIPDLRSLGWTLRGGRVVPGEIGPAALLVYEDATGDRLSLTTGRVTNPAPFDTAYEVVAGPALVWMDGPLAFGIATSREGNWLSDHAHTLYRAVYQSRGE